MQHASARLSVGKAALTRSELVISVLGSSSEAADGIRLERCIEAPRILLACCSPE